MTVPDDSSTPSASTTAPAGDWRPYVWREPAAFGLWLCAATSIASLLLYLAGVVELNTGARWLLLPGGLVLVVGIAWAKHRGKVELLERLVGGCWAGLVATFFYDLVRVPVAMMGVPVFKAISYFGTVFLNQPAPGLGSEIVGWAYHLSNGVGFALMYALWVRRPAWWTAVLWGLLLEGVMLLTPYAEVFGYKISRQFLAITIGAHVVYGLGLWAGLRFRNARASVMQRWPWTRHVTAGVLLLTPLGLAAIAFDFHVRHARHIPPSPPEYVGAHLYTTWDVLEPDRVVAMWVWTRYVDKHARFHFVPPFSRISHGKPFDVPESDIRRTGVRSATEVLLANHGLKDPRLALLARTTHLYEITPWQVGSDPLATELGTSLKEFVPVEINASHTQVVQRIFAWLDEWYSKAR